MSNNYQLATLSSLNIAQIHMYTIPNIVQKSNTIFTLLKDIYYQHKLKHTLLIAVGGLGRGMQYPYSDVDVFFIYDENNNEKDKIEKYIQQAWDSKLNFSSNVFSKQEFLGQITKHWELVSSFLDAKLLAGNKIIFWALQRKFNMWLNNNLQDFLVIKQQEVSHRHLQYPLFALEPNCKQHAGALRDLDYIHWICKALKISQNGFFLRKHLKISINELKEYRKQSKFLSTIRYHLHLTTNKREDILRFEYQSTLAIKMNFISNNYRIAQEQLMRSYFRTTRMVIQLQKQFNYLVEQYILRLNNTPQFIEGGFSPNEYTIINDVIHVFTEDFFINNPLKVLEVFYLLENYESLSILTTRALFKARKILDEKWANNANNQTAFIKILHSKKVDKILYAMHEHSILGKYLTYFRNITGQMQHDLLHIYTVDQHTLKVIGYIKQFTQVENIQNNILASQLVQEFKPVWIIYLSALFHDLGKGQGGNHSIIGADYAKQFSLKHKMSKPSAKLFIWLVENHLLLSLNAQNQDIHQKGVIANFCNKLNIYIKPNSSMHNKFYVKFSTDKIEKINHIEKTKKAKNIKSTKYLKQHRNKQSLYILKALYILTIADIKGTNPKAYNGWRASLIDSFFYACSDYLQQKNHHSSIINKQEQALLLCKEALHSKIISWYKQLNKAFFIRHTIQDIAWISQNILQQKNGDIQSTGIYIKQQQNIYAWQLWIHTNDLPSIFSHVCKILAKNNINIMYADIDSTKYNFALNCLEIDSSKYINNSCTNINLYNKNLQQKLMQNIINKLTIELQNPHTLEILPLNSPVKLNQHHSPRVRQFLSSSQVSIVSQSNEYILKIKTINQIGLLYKIANILAHNNINIRQAHITTMGEKVEDTFFINGNNLKDSNFILNLEIKLLHVLNNI